jgi:hypothetical protein
VVTMTRPGAVAKIRESSSPTARSGCGTPGTSAFVESARSTWTPPSPRRASAARSVGRPSIGVWSSLKSPVWTIVPTGEWRATATHPGIEWVRCTNSARYGPTARETPGSTSMSSASSRRRCSSSLLRRSASTKRVP